jgi:glycosyltransferase involved in cell wall biosynthesis
MSLNGASGMGSDQTKEKIRLSVVIPAYNHERYVAECLESVLCQLGSEDEIIVIDDGSKDGTASVIEEIISQQRREVQFFKKSNEGLVKTLEMGLDLAKGEYLLFLASDDKLLDGGLEAAMGALPPKAAFAIFGGRYFGDLQKDIYLGRMRTVLRGRSDKVLEFLESEVPTPLLLQTTLINAAFLRGIGGFSTAALLDDWPTFIRMFRAVVTSNKIWGFNDAIYLTGYRIHGAGVHTNIHLQHAKIIDVLLNYSTSIHRDHIIARHRIHYGLDLLHRKDLSGLGVLKQGFQVTGYFQGVGIAIGFIVMFFLRKLRRLVFN